MAKTVKPTNEEQVADYIQKLDHPLKDLVMQLRIIISTTSPLVAEQIKWNSPAFFYTGPMKPFDPKTYKNDIVVLNLHKKDEVLLIFPTGAIIADNTGLLQGKFTDGRKMVSFKNMEEVGNRKKDLQTVILQWIALIDK